MGEQGIERVKGRSKSKLDLVSSASMLPMAFSGRNDRRIDFAGEDLAVRFQGKRNRERAVTRVGVPPNTEEACEERHEVRLFRRKQHLNTDDGNHTVRQFTPEGRLLMTMGSERSLRDRL